MFFLLVSNNYTSVMQLFNENLNDVTFNENCLNIAFRNTNSFTTLRQVPPKNCSTTAINSLSNKSTPTSTTTTFNTNNSYTNISIDSYTTTDIIIRNDDSIGPIPVSVSVIGLIILFGVGGAAIIFISYKKIKKNKYYYDCETTPTSHKPTNAMTVSSTGNSFI